MGFTLHFISESVSKLHRLLYHIYLMGSFTGYAMRDSHYNKIISILIIDIIMEEYLNEAEKSLPPTPN